MFKVISMADRKFRKSHAGLIVAACNVLDEEVRKLVFEGDIPPGELLVALASRLGSYLACTDADKEEISKKLAKIIYRYATKV